MAGTYAWLSFGNAKAQLAQRLADPQKQKWSDPELGLMIAEALRTWNSLTLSWKKDFSFTPSVSWNFLSTMAGSPRLQTLTDDYMYTVMQYSLVEPPTGGGPWQGTAQFSLSDLTQALQRRRDEMILQANNNQGFQSVTGTPNVIRNYFGDTVLEPQRIRWLGIDPGTGDPLPPVTLYRDDKLAIGYFDPQSYTAPAGTPSAWLVSSEPPLSFDLDIPPNTEGVYECLCLLSGNNFLPPTASLLNIPDDYAWVAKWGAMSDLLSRDSEATDRERAAWCEARYQDGLKLLTNTPWILDARINGIVTNFPSMDAMDRYSAEWDSDPNFSAVVIGGIDTVWAPIGVGVSLTVLGNAPVPSADGDFVQVSRAAWDSVLNYAQFNATFKLGGAEFSQALQLYQTFIQAAAAENDRLEELGLFGDVLVKQASDEMRNVERFSPAGQSS